MSMGWASTWRKRQCLNQIVVARRDSCTLRLIDAHRHASRGHATLAVDELPRYEAADVAKVDVLLNGEPVEALAFASRSTDARDRGRRAVEKLRRHVPRQLFECIIQARVNGAVVARARIAPLRKDVLTTGGSKAVLGKDRKKKLLEKQKRGKARQKTIGKVALGQDALWAVVGS